MIQPKIRHRGRHLEFLETERGWEYVNRPNAKGCVAILAITDDQRVILTEQYRPPVDRHVIELPAGLAGDIPFQEDEPLETAARRELKEETGYEAKKWTKLFEGPSSAGIATEVVTLFLASGLIRVSDGGGTAHENIKVHHVHRSDVLAWCLDRQAEGMMVDFKVLAALEAARSASGDAGGRLWY